METEWISAPVDGRLHFLVLGLRLLLAVGISGSSMSFIDGSSSFIFGTDVVFLTRSATFRPHPTTSGRHSLEVEDEGHLKDFMGPFRKEKKSLLCLWVILLIDKLLWSCLALTWQVVQLVLADASVEGGPRVAFANGVFVDTSTPLRSSFKEVAVGKYKAETHSVDFQTKAAEVACQVNTWVEKLTSGLIKEILPDGSVDSTTRLVLGNALYFKGAWTQEFDASKTKDGEFHLLDGSSVQASFMSSTNEQYLSSHDNLKVLKLPYRQGGDMRQFSMYILLPEANDGLWNLAGKVSSEPEFLEKHTPTEKVLVRNFKLPKFKISFGFEASSLLKGLGLHLPFSCEADLSEMVDSAPEQNLYISSVFHKSFVEVNEEGTEAAAATAGGGFANSPFH
ncbi:Serpin-ZX [Triticum urartu]|uniref:Serpin-ZX n=1 Tax=Triticum urartu TaxID=4572 RepID=M8AJN3_TRIUA|nr:Serpin-ZX [Triticum urartu]